MKHSVPLVSVVVLSHDRPGYLRRVLDSITSQSYPNLEIIVVDNQSDSSETIACLVNQYANVQLIQTGANLGFTGGMNFGLDAASGEYVHCTLDDVLLDKDCIRHLAEYMQQHPATGLLSGVLYHEDGATIHSAGGKFSLSSVYRRRLFGAGEKDTGQFQRPYEVNYVPGGMIFSRLDLLRRLNGFRREFFMYTEDMDLCLRVAKLGHAIVVVPAAKVRVLDAPHAFKSESIAFHKFKNFFSLYLLHARARVLPEFYLRYGVINLLRALVSDRQMVWPMLRAWGWFLRKSPEFIKERRVFPSAVSTKGL
jgi:GT2 family glycosyltransferase